MSRAVEPVRLRADNFTPPSRTPWGGRRIRGTYKAGLGLPPGDDVVGESWEISVEPSFPSRLSGSGEALAEVIGRAPKAWLGASTAEAFGDQTPLLVKLLDTADNLSVQVHPSHGDSALGAGESGKPEAWVILEADPGAGLYLGFAEGVTRAEVEGCIQGAGRLEELMNFVPVGAGDGFTIAAGIPHAVGAGITLLEPQLIRPGCRGLTYRFWDWNRRYDSSGRPSRSGSPRRLHLDRALAVTAWGGPTGDALVQRCRSTPQATGEAGIHRVIDWPWFTVDCWRGNQTFRVATAETMLHITCVGGALELRWDGGWLRLRCGQSAVAPAAVTGLQVTGQEMLAYVARCDR